MSLEIDQKVYNLSKISMFMNKTHYDKSLLENISNNKIIAISEDKTKFAIKKFNGRIENWYDINTGKSNGWDDNIYTTNLEKVLEIYEYQLEKFKAEQELKDLEEIKQLEQKIEKIKNKENLEHKFIEKQEDYVNKIFDKYQEEEITINFKW